jgi:glycosyltransferase involved in cell wall biosynthesis
VQGATLSVCPLRVARGVQNKVLEAMAMGVPVLASPAAAAGIEAVVGRELEVAECESSGAATAGAIVDLVTDPARCERLARAARELVVSRYSWQPCAELLHELLVRAAASPRRGAARSGARYSLRR